MESKQQVRKFIKSKVGRDDLGDAEDFFELGLVSSMFVMQIVLFLERSFKLVLSGEDLQFEYFRTIDAIDGLVLRKRR